MRHPFDGILGQEQAGLTRRGALGQLAAATAGILGLGAAAQAQKILPTEAVNEQGAPQVTTLALGEEGGATQVKGEEGKTAALTTEPFGEEAGKVLSRPAPGLEDASAAKPTAAKGEDGGATTKALREEAGGLTTQALGEEGGPMTRAAGEDGGPSVKVEPLARDLDDKQLEPVWTDLGSTEPAKALQACAVLYGAKKAVPFLKGHLKLKATAADAKQVEKLVADLDHDSFQVREQADDELEKLGLAALPALEAAFKATRSIEVRMRVKRLLDRCKEMPEFLQNQRGLEVLVALRTKEAREVVEELAKGAEKDLLTQAAKNALERFPSK